MSDQEKEKFVIMQEDIKRLKDDISDIKSMLKQHIEKEDNRFNGMCESIDKKYAGKMAEKLVYGMCGAILLAVVVALLSQIIK